MIEIFKKSIRVLNKKTDINQSLKYAMISFDMPNNVQSLEISISRNSFYEAQLPIALFDSNKDIRIFKASEGTIGYFKENYHIEYSVASEGAIPGLIPNGVWKMVLYKRRFSEDLVVSISVKVRYGEVKDEYPKKYTFMDVIKKSTPGWYRGELHVHSSESTGRTSVERVLSSADRVNLDFVAITDHFTASHWLKIENCYKKYNVLPIASMEISGDRGHANVHNLSKWVNPLVDDNEELANFLGLNSKPSMDGIADEVHSQGGLFCINHPLSGMVGWHYQEFEISKCDLLDCWATSDADVSLLYPTLWDGYLSQGYRLIGVGSSDSHNPDQENGPWSFGRIFTNVYSEELSGNGLIDGLKKGRVYTSMGCSKMEFYAFYNDTRYEMGESIPYLGGKISFTFEIWDNPSGNLFVMLSSQLIHVEYFENFSIKGRQMYKFDLAAEDIRFISKKFAFIRIEFFEDTVKSKFWGMAWKDSRSMRLLSNPIWINDRRKV